MASWRDGMSEAAQADFEALLDVTVAFVKEQLPRFGEIYPYSAVVGRDGSTGIVMPDMGGNDHPSSDDVLKACIDGILSARAELRASALVADVTVPELATDAIQIDLEHSEGVAVRFLLPYWRKRIRRDFGFGELDAQTGPRLFWS
jgi:hypothetical protein